MIDLPRFSAVMGFCGWLLPVTLISLEMSRAFPQWRLLDSALVVTSGVAAAERLLDR